MKITLVRKGIFGKKYLRLPEGFLKNHEIKSGKATPIYGQCNDDFIIVSTSEKELKKKEYIINELLNSDNEQPDYVIRLSAKKEEVSYKNVSGLFCFRGEVYYKPNGGAGKSLTANDVAFGNSIKERFPEEFENCTLQAIGAVMVQPLDVM